MATATTENSSVGEYSHPATDTTAIRTTDRVAALHHRTVDPNSMLGADIRDPVRCPATLQGGMYLKGSPSYAIDEFINNLRHNLLPRVLRLQNINTSNTQIRNLLDVLPYTNIYAANIGEADHDGPSR
jgi:hypothetical protein